jgi:hypothetical protein
MGPSSRLVLTPSVAPAASAPKWRDGSGLDPRATLVSVRAPGGSAPFPDRSLYGAHRNRPAADIYIEVEARLSGPGCGPSTIQLTVNISRSYYVLTIIWERRRVVATTPEGLQNSERFDGFGVDIG